MSVSGDPIASECLALSFVHSMGTLLILISITIFRVNRWAPINRLMFGVENRFMFTDSTRSCDVRLCVNFGTYFAVVTQIFTRIMNMMRN